MYYFLLCDSFAPARCREGGEHRPPLRKVVLPAQVPEQPLRRPEQHPGCTLGPQLRKPAENVLTDIILIWQFQQIVAISLEERTDKRDALTVQAALSKIDLNLVKGVDGAKVPFKALPYVRR